MRRTHIPLLLLALFISMPATAQVWKVFDASSTASGDSGELPYSTTGFSVQFCGGTGGDAFSGSFVVKQGMETGGLVQSYSSGAIAGLSGCSATYYIAGFRQSSYLQILVTKSAGKYTVWVRADK